ncbi:hypothetical protein M0651_07495 [Paenibacillus sp. MBLB2552]|uniref:Uncharacterized protein n=1 Tax=Paenibacillus mellifer TaxID=2937794 RepID=A0A9X2BNL7_9BACL|nr:hypothetical protein [Paenibacillus mellifer]MCK8487009.1 hypothetical protein [Paenibacillus mellifer]
MIKEKVFFQPSINIRFDYGRQILYERYLPTPSHADALKGLLKGFLGEGTRAHIIVGPYGSGKSLVGTILAGIVSKNVSNELFQQVLKKFQSVDDQIHSLLLDVKQTNKTFIPVFLNGNEGNFRRSLLSALYNTLREQDLNFSEPIIVADILRIVDTWKDKYESTYNQFIVLLEEMKWTVDTWRKDIEKVNVSAIEWFKKIYPVLTSGSHLSINFDKDIINQLKYILSELRAKNLGLFIIYDEFGRFLQTLPPTEVHETMQELQDLAEFSNSDQGNNLNMLLITHRNLGQYALRYNEELQKEFQRIEKRYNTYYTKADPSTFIRLSSLLTQDYRNDKIKVDDFVQELRYFNLFPDLNVFEIDSLVIKKSYPLHPVSLFVLPQLANLVAQNERTLFTFLESDERGGLKSYYERKKDWYRIDSVFDYFEPSFGEFELDSLTGQAYSLYHRLQKRLPESPTYSDQLKVLKLLAIWNISGLYPQQDPNEEFISFAFAWEISWTRLILEQLHSKKVIRFNSAFDYWELFEGSSVDIEASIDERLQSHPLKKRQRMDLLRSVLIHKYVLPKQYNDEKSITRFAPVVPIYQSELNDEGSFQSVFADYDNVDAAIVYVFNDTDTDNESLRKFIKEWSVKKEKILFVTANEGISIDRDIERLAMLHLMRDDKYFISQDKYLLDEIETIISHTIFKLNQALEPITKFQHCSWIYKGEHHTVKSGMALSQFLSDVMEKIYSDTPEIRNEAFNRNTITKVQRKAAIQVLDKIIQIHKTKNIEIQGYGPDYLIFATVIKNNRINFDHPEITDNESLKKLRNELLDIIEQGSGKVSDLIKIISNPPYGVRKPVVPILFAALLHHEWNYLMFYHNGMFNAKVDGDLLYYVVDNPEQYTFKYLPFNSKYNGLLQIIKGLFEDFIQIEDDYLHPAVFVNQVLLRWLRSLPRITQNTGQLSELANQIKECIRQGEVQPETSIERIHQLCKSINKMEVLSSVRSECEDYNETHKNHIGKCILQAANALSFDELKGWAEKQEAIVKASNPFVQSILTAQVSNWVDHLCEKVVGVKRENWSDTTDQLFISQVNTYLENLKSEINVASYIEIKVGNSSIAIPKVSLSEKSQAIFNSTRANMVQMKRKVPKAEIQILLLELLKEISED